MTMTKIDKVTEVIMAGLVAANAKANELFPETSTGTTPTVPTEPIPVPPPAVTPPVPVPPTAVSPVYVIRAEPDSDFWVDDVTTLQPSFKGARVGKWGDIVVPTSVLPAPVGKGVYNMSLPIQGKTRFPFYSELQFDRVSRAHGLADEGATLKRRAATVQRYINMMRAHGIEPIKQAMSLYPTDWDQWKDYGASFRQLVLTGCIAPPCMFGPTPGTLPPIAFLQKVQAAIVSGELPKGTWCYPCDEGEGDAAATAQHLIVVKHVKQYCPAIEVHITRRPDVAFKPYVDRFYPVLELAAGLGPIDAGYVSCMSQGSCANGVQGVPTGTPMLGCVEAPVFDPVMLPILLWAAGAKSGLYYCVSENIERALTPGGLYFCGGNGDGTLVYPFKQPLADGSFGGLPSVRMQQLSEGLHVANGLMAAVDAYGMAFVSSKISPLIRSFKDWERSPHVWRGALASVGVVWEGFDS